jgi:radical SAM superfamily enzyme YgiQ (UPF0313 family)
MKILALNPPFLPKFSRESRSPAVTKSGTLYYPMWLCYAVGRLEKAGHEVCLVDAPASGLSAADVAEIARAFRPDMAVLDTSTPSIYNDISVGEALKRELPELFVALVGVHVSALPVETLSLSPNIDAVAFGEYDETITELADKLSVIKTNQAVDVNTENQAAIKNDTRVINNENGGADNAEAENHTESSGGNHTGSIDNTPIDNHTDPIDNAPVDNHINPIDDTLAAIRGIAFRDSTGAIWKNEARPFIEDLDALPFVSDVYQRHLDINPYFYGHSRHPIVVIVTGRGCPFHCTFCVVPQTLQGHRYRKRSIESIVQEFLFIRDNFPNVREIMIEDDTLTADRKRCRDLSEALIATGGHRIPWSANSRADVNYETMRLMRKAGCRLLCVGFESGEQAILDNIQKSITIEKLVDFTRDAKRAGILVHGCFMVGNRGETRQTLQKTLEFAKELSPDTAQFYPIMVYPGTTDYAHFTEKGWIVSDNFRNWLTPEGLHSSVVSNPDLTYEELVAFCDRARRAFYLRPSYMLAKLRQMIAYPGEAKRIIKAAFTFMRYLLSPTIKKRGK